MGKEGEAGVELTLEQRVEKFRKLWMESARIIADEYGLGFSAKAEVAELSEEGAAKFGGKELMLISLEMLIGLSDEGKRGADEASGGPSAEGSGN